MKKPGLFFAGAFVLVLFTTIRLNAQDEKAVKSFNVGADFYTNYIWRGTKFGQGPSVQPSVKYNQGGLTVGVWGAFDAAGYAEADPYISYAFKSGLSMGVTDYYYPGLDLFDVSDSTGSHAFEANAGFSKGKFSISANYIFNEAGGAASQGGDMYFQIVYTAVNVNLFAGAGNGWHTTDGDFNICNLGIGTSKTVEITDKFSIPVTGQVIINPDRKQMYVVAGFSF